MAYLIRILVFVFFSLSGLAQTPVSPVQAVDIVDIPAQLISDEEFVDVVINRSQRITISPAFQQQLAEIQTDVVKLQRNMNTGNLEAMHYAQLEMLDRYHNAIMRKLDNWMGNLKSMAQPLSSNAAHLALKRANWIATSKANAGLLSPAMLARIAQLNQSFDLAEAEVSKPLSAILALSQQGALLNSELLESQQAVHHFMTRKDEQLWHISSPTLWSALAGATAHTPLEAQKTITSLLVEREFMLQFDEVTQSQYVAILVLCGILLPLIIWWSRQSIGIDLGAAQQSTHRQILARPLAAWGLLLLMALILVNMEGSYLRQKILLLLAWWPVMRLQSTSMQTEVGRWQYATLAFFLIAMLGNFFSSNQLEFRLALLFNSIFMLSTLCYMLHRQRDFPRQQTTHFGLRIALLLGGIVILAIATVANMSGALNLATLLTQGVMNCIYLGFFILAVRNVIFAHVRLLFGRRTALLRNKTQHAHQLLGVIELLFKLALAWGWIYGLMISFRVLHLADELATQVSAYSMSIGTITLTVGGCVVFVFSVFLSFWVAKSLRNILADDVFPLLTLPRGVANSASTMAYYFLLMLGLMTAITASGFQMSQLAMVLGALSVGIGFGLQSVVNNFVSGLILMLERPIQPGDTVELSGVAGNIRDIGMRTTTLTTFDGADVLIPNGMLLSERLTNWTLNNKRRRIEIPISTGLGCDPLALQALMLAELKNSSAISQQPEPEVLFKGFDYQSLNYIVQAWTDDYDQSLAIRSRTTLRLYAVITEFQAQEKAKAKADSAKEE